MDGTGHDQNSDYSEKKLNPNDSHQRNQRSMLPNRRSSGAAGVLEEVAETTESVHDNH